MADPEYGYPNYPDLYGGFGWALGVHRAPPSYQHPWLVVLKSGTYGAWSRQAARDFWREWKSQ